MVANFGKSVGEDTIFTTVNSIIKRGLIKNPSEYRLLIEALDLYADDKSKTDIIKSVSQLIHQYEKRHLKEK